MEAVKINAVNSPLFMRWYSNTAAIVVQVKDASMLPPDNHRCPKASVEAKVPAQEYTSSIQPPAIWGPADTEA